MIFAQIIDKIPEFYMIFARKMPEFHIIIAQKYFSQILGGGERVPPVSYAYVPQLQPGLQPQLSHASDFAVQ